MKRITLLLFSGLLLSVSGCNHVGKQKQMGEETSSQKEINPTQEADQSKPIETYTIKPEDILTDFQTWYKYTYYNIRLTQDFTGLNANSDTISKISFLNQLATGKYIALKISNQVLPTYKLFKFSAKDPEMQSVRDIAKQMADTEIFYYKMEGKPLPDFEFVDLNGQKYNNKNTKGKTLVLKCWFIKCGACIQEFPEVNKLANEYKENKDVLFISLATDKKEKLISFLKEKPLEYAVIPSSEKFLRESLKVQSYPTHFLVNKDGKIIKMVNVIYDLIPFLKKEAPKNTL